MVRLRTPLSTRISLVRRLQSALEMREKVLIVFFSRTGTTRLLAEGIARATHGDLEELRERRSRRGVIGWLRSGYEGTYGRAAEPLALRHDLSAYDIVFIGSPTWNQALSSPVRGFLQRSRGQLTNVALFATCAGRGANQVLAQMTDLLPAPPLATLGMLENDVRHGAAVWIGEFVEAALDAWRCKHPASDGAVTRVHEQPGRF